MKFDSNIRVLSCFTTLFIVFLYKTFNITQLIIPQQTCAQRSLNPLFNRPTEPAKLPISASEKAAPFRLKLPAPIQSKISQSANTYVTLRVRLHKENSRFPWGCSTYNRKSKCNHGCTHINTWKCSAAGERPSERVPAAPAARIPRSDCPPVPRVRLY